MHRPYSSGEALMLELWTFISDEHNNRALALLLAFATIVVGIAPIFFSVRESLYLRRKEAKQNAYAFIERIQAQQFQQARRRAREVFDKGEPFHQLSASDRDAVRKYLNSMELLAGYLNDDIVDQRTVRKFLGLVFLVDWRRAESIIHEVRAALQHPSLYTELEFLLERWSHGR
jgi:Domain of unknown function (DUF4760)